LTADARAVLSVDLGAVVRNWRLLCARHAPGDVAAVVKADGYGLGAVPIALALREAGCRHFFVAHASEGEALRDALGDGPLIAVLNGFGGRAHPRLTPVLNSLADLRAHRGPALIHLDTGMSRLGLPPDELDALAAEPSRLGAVQPLFWMTHLSCADEPEHPLNALQARRFAAACARLPAAPRSFANSSGLFLGPRFGSDLARPGAALLGLNPTPGHPNPMEPVVRLRAPILQLREVAPGEPVGYGAGWTAPRLTRVATVALGYADGWPRALEGMASGLLHGTRAPMVGRVSMDLTTFDVTGIPEAAPGDMVELIGPHQDPDALAAMSGTIGYEILTRLGRRFRREYQAP
jgi:alanine racemase